LYSTSRSTANDTVNIGTATFSIERNKDLVTVAVI